MLGKLLWLYNLCLLCFLRVNLFWLRLVRVGNMKMKFFPLALGWLLAANFARAQNGPPAAIPAQRLISVIQVDGVLKEKAWKSAQRISKFMQREPNAGKAATEKTAVAMLYDANHLYLGVWCYDREFRHLTAQKMQRDFDFDVEDNFIVIIDTYNDERNGYLFVVNPNGAIADALITDNGNYLNKDWDGVWEASARIDTAGWFAEIAIPFSTLKFNAAQQTWGVNFERNIRRKREQVLWQGWSPDASIEQVSRAGNLTGLQGLRSGNAFELRPYSLAGLENPRGAGNKSAADFGGDLDYLITPTLKLNVTLNPDFAQVESDRAQINLTRFSLKFPEKRKFFLEGRDVFDFGLGKNIQPFYSRRIGLADNGAEIPVLGGVRLLGKSGRTILGGMVLQSRRREAIPSTNYAVMRWRQEVLAQSSVGLIATTRAQSGHFNSTYGGDYLYSTSNLFGGKNFMAGAAYALSHTSDAAAKTGSAQRVFLSYPNDLIELDLEWERASQSFNPEVGFLRRTNYQRYAAEFELNPRVKSSAFPWLRKMEFQPVELEYYRNAETGNLQSLAMAFRPFGFSTKSRERFKLNIRRDAENLEEDFEIYDGVVIPANTYWFTHYEAELETFAGRKLSGYASVNWGDFYDGTRAAWAGGLVWRMSKYLSLSFDHQQNRIALPGGRFRINESGGRADFALLPRLFGALFAQWNDEDEEMRLNFRVNWIPKPGADFYLVINQAVDTSRDRWLAINTTVLTKLVWHFPFSRRLETPSPKPAERQKSGVK